jgi:cytochrome c
MRNRFVSVASTLVLAGAALTAAARGTPAEAKALLEKAVAHYRAVGRTQALADFNARKGEFVDRDLYVVCIAPDRTIVANGAFPSVVGASADALRDANGKGLGQALWDAASGQGDGSVHYEWLNPVSGQTESKVSFARKAGDDVCVVGAYSPPQ